MVSPDAYRARISSLREYFVGVWSVRGLPGTDRLMYMSTIP